MIFFLDEDQAYAHWVARHREGFVLAGRHRPRWGQFELHRADCLGLRASGSKRTHFTTGGRFRAWGRSREEVESWVEEQGKTAAFCDACRPGEEFVPDTTAPPRLSRLAREVLDYVVESAEIHFGQDSPPYHLSLDDIAGCFAKTPAQLAAIVRRLTAQGLAEIEGGDWRNTRKRGAPLLVFPTLEALHLLGTYQAADDAELKMELQRLHDSPSHSQN